MDLWLCSFRWFEPFVDDFVSCLVGGQLEPQHRHLIGPKDPLVDPLRLQLGHPLRDWEKKSASVELFELLQESEVQSGDFLTLSLSLSLVTSTQNQKIIEIL